MFTEQTKCVGKTIRLIDDYETVGTIVRDDLYAPFITIIACEDGTFRLGAECGYTFVNEEDGAKCC